jgi:hypothetical protein
VIAFATGLSQLPFLPSALKYSKVIGDLSSAVSPEELASAADPVSVLDPPLLLPAIVPMVLHVSVPVINGRDSRQLVWHGVLTKSRL